MTTFLSTSVLVQKPEKMLQFFRVINSNNQEGYLMPQRLYRTIWMQIFPRKSVLRDSIWMGGNKEKRRKFLLIKEYLQTILVEYLRTIKPTSALKQRTKTDEML